MVSISHFILILFLTGFEFRINALDLSPVSSSSFRPQSRAELSRQNQDGNTLSVQNSQYIDATTPSYRTGAAEQNSSAVLRLNDQWAIPGGMQAQLKFKDEWSATEKWNYVDVHEAYLSYKFRNSDLSLGRKLETWSAWDHEWRQGFFQSRYLENRLRSEEAGLVGAFWSGGNAHWQFTAAALPVYIPDFGPHFDVEDNRFVSKNPWFHAPSSRFVYRGQPGEIHYDIQRPSLASVVQHPGAAAKLEYHDDHAQTRLSYAYKPLAAFVLGFPSDHQFVVASTVDFMSIAIAPRIIYDRVLNLDQGFETGPWFFSGSVAYDNPEVDRGPADWTAQQVAPATIFSGAVARRLGTQGVGAPQLRVGFLRVEGGDAPATGRFAGSQNFSDRRFQFYEAYLIALRKDFHFGALRTLETEARAIYDRLQDGGVASFNLAYAFDRNWRTELQIDFIGLFSPRAQITDGFIANYRANDRLGLGISYAY